MKRIAHIVNDPKFLVKAHITITCIWILLIIPTLLLWPESILWLAMMSIWANIAAHAAGAQAAHAEKMEQSGLCNEELDKKLDQILKLLKDQKPPEAEGCL